MKIFYLFFLGYIDFEIFTPKILPENPCYYHTHAVPTWVDFFYMNNFSNGHPDGSVKHFLLLLVFSMFLGHKTAKLIRLKKQANNSTKNNLLDSIK